MWNKGVRGFFDSVEQFGKRHVWSRYPMLIVLSAIAFPCYLVDGIKEWVNDFQESWLNCADKNIDIF